MASENLKILVTGATGYIGGSVLAALLASPHPKLQAAQYSVLLRDEDGSRQKTLQEAYGARVKALPFSDLGDTAHVEAVAAEHDVAINTALGFHPTFGAALARGLARRGKGKGFLVHTSGTSNLADHPLTGTAHPEREFDDANGAATYEWEVAAERAQPYAQRTAELSTIDAGLASGAKTLVIMSPTIYGLGTGLFNTHSLQVPIVTRYVAQRGEGVVLGTGAGVWDNVHVADLAQLYTLVLTTYLDDPQKIPTGKAGVIFSGTRRHSWREFAQGIADAVHAQGAIPSSALKELTIAEGGSLFGDPEASESGLASNSKTVASVAKSLGWQPRHGEESWKRGFQEEAEAVVKSKA